MKKKSLVGEFVSPKFYGVREDGTSKGSGFLGEIPMASGEKMTEKSVTVGIDGKDILMPTVVPTLSKDELEFLKKGGDPLKNQKIMDKAIDHAMKRIGEGLSPFHNDGPAPEWKKQ